jgi:hypothetical protein
MLVGIGCISFSSLLLELSLTRLFSVVLFYHFAFMAISIALLGLGAGGLAALLRARENTGSRTVQSAYACLLSGAAGLLALAIVLHARVPLEASGVVFFRLAVIYFVAALPFFFNGFVLSTLLSCFGDDVHRLYFADLAGAAVACGLLVPLMNTLGAPSAVMTAILIAVVAALAVGGKDLAPGVRTLVAAAAVLLLVPTLGNVHGRWFDIRYAKGHERHGVEFKKWNSFSRVEVTGGKSKDILIDDDADTAMVGNSLEEVKANPALARGFMRYSAAVPDLVRRPDSVLVIGSGGGYDVMRALVAGATRVTAVEINPIIVRDLMQGRYRQWTHGLYDRADVHAVVAEGRSFVRRSQSHYDVIQATMVDTWASTAAGALALSETNLYTVEAFREYLRHLTPDGVLGMTRWEFRQPREALRVVAVAREALRKEFGITDPRAYIAVVSDGRLTDFGVTVTTLIRRQPFTPAELAALHADVNANPPMQIQYAPDTAPPNPYSALLQSKSPANFFAAYPYDIRPTTDDRPFFFYTVRTRELLRMAAIAPGTRGYAMDWKNNLAVFLLVSLLLISALAIVVFLLVPMRMAATPAIGLGLLYFIALGLGYILIEIALIQRFVLFLGHPTYALTVVVLLMLGSSSLGSLLGPRIGRPIARARWAIAGILVLAIVYSQVGRGIGALVGLPLTVKVVLSALLLVPLGLLMGIPFPAGLHGIGRRGTGAVEWAWTLNAAASVLGSVLAIFIGIHFGMGVALLSGAVAYLGAGLASASAIQEPRPTVEPELAAPVA